jgi:hypothetical protein
MKMAMAALAACGILAASSASAADLGPYPDRAYGQARPLPPQGCCPPPYYAQPYYDGVYAYGPSIYYGHPYRPYPYAAAYPYWRGPEVAYYGGRRFWGGGARWGWGGRWGGHGRRW